MSAKTILDPSCIKKKIINPMRVILIILALIATLGTQLRAEPKLDASSFMVSVNLTDGATGACWTGVRDVRQYIEEKLQEIGFKLGHFHTAEASKNQNSGDRRWIRHRFRSPSKSNH